MGNFNMAAIYSNVVTAGTFLASILLKEMRYLVYIRYLWYRSITDVQCTECRECGAYTFEFLQARFKIQNFKHYLGHKI
jgi:hypothetical protein